MFGGIMVHFGCKPLVWDCVITIFDDGMIMILFVNLKTGYDTLIYWIYEFYVILSVVQVHDKGVLTFISVKGMSKVNFVMKRFFHFVCLVGDGSFWLQTVYVGLCFFIIFYNVWRWNNHVIIFKMDEEICAITRI